MRSFAFLMLCLAPAFCRADNSVPALWDSSIPVPKVNQLTPLENVSFHIIKARTPEIDGYNWLHGLALAWHKNKLYATFGHNKGAENTASEEARGCISEDGGKTWGDLFTIDVGEEPELAVSHGVLFSHDDKLWAFQGAFYGKMKKVHTRAYSLDEATGEWKQHGVVVDEGFWPMQEPLKMNDGNWIMSGIRVEAGYGGSNDPPAVAISQGDDFTKWDLVVIPKDPKLVAWGESTVFLHDDQIVNVSRYFSIPKALVATSLDFGRTWTETRPSNLPMTTSKPYTGTLSTGQHYLVCTTAADAGGRRYPLTIAVTKKGSRQFSKVYQIRAAVQEGPGESHPRAALSYPYAIEKQGKLYVAYSYSAGRGANRNSAELAIIAVDQLKVD